MKRIDVRLINVDDQLRQGGKEPLTAILRLDEANRSGGIWHILEDTLPKDSDTLIWGHNRGATGQIAVPMYSYQTADYHQELLPLLGAQFGILLAAQADRWRPYKHFVVFLSNVFSRDDGLAGHRLFIGAAIQTGEQ